MNKTKIDWATASWNPVTGCLHGCGYCYARNQARRFAGHWSEEHLRHLGATGELHDIAEPMHRHTTGKNRCAPVRSIKAPYPYDFDPTLHRYRLAQPQAMKEPQNIFVCSMSDLFGAWVPDEWIKAVFDACTAAPWHNYIFLTKNPARLPLSSYIYNGVFSFHSENLWFGATITNQKSLETGYKRFANIGGNTFLSIEPLHEPINLSRIDTGDVIYNIEKGMAYYFGGGQKVQNPKWVIVGAETGNRKEKVKPKREWVEEIAHSCRAAGVPLFMKSSLAEIWGEPLIQEYPDGLKCNA